MDNFYYVYVLQSKRDGKFYIGCTKNLRIRFEQHNNRTVKSTQKRAPFKLIYYEASYGHNDALKREEYLKTTYGHRYIKNRLKSYFTG